MRAFETYAQPSLTGSNGAFNPSGMDAAMLASNPDNSVLMVFNAGTDILFVDMAQTPVMAVNRGYPVAPGATVFLAWREGQTFFQMASAGTFNVNIAFGRFA